jgi:hypothetical protein
MLICNIGTKMQTGEISFCNKFAFNIKSDDVKKTVMYELMELFAFNIIQKQHNTFSCENMHIINANPHLITLRSNGNPYLLYLTKHNNTNICIFVDKKVQHGYFLPRMIITKLWFDDSLFDNTLFDGEMIKDNNGTWMFLISDIIGKNGKILGNLNIMKRINIAIDILSNQYIQDDMAVCRLDLKRYFTYDNLNYMLGEYMKSLPYTCRGVYFKSLFLKFKDTLVNFDDSLIKKNKVVVKHDDFVLVDDICMQKEALIHAPQTYKYNTTCGGALYREFFATKTSQPDVYMLLDMETNQTFTACINSLHTSQMMLQSFADKSLTYKQHVKCIFSEKFSKWVPVELF